MKFTLGGADIALSRAQIENRLADVEPEPLKQVFVVVGARKFPVKQALAVGAGIVRSGFTTQDALRILRKLGFEVGERPVTFQLRTQVLTGFPDFWDTAVGGFPEFFAAAREVGPLSNEVFSVPVTEWLHLLTRNLAKSAVNSFGALLILCMNGYGFDALKISRSMFESAVNVAYLRRHPDQMNDFVDYDWIKKKKFIEELKKHDPESARLHAHEEGVVLRNYNGVVGRFKTKRNGVRGRWSKESLAQMAAEVGLSSMYFSVYGPGSSAQHVDIRGLMMQFGGSRAPDVADIVTAPHLQWIQPALAGGHTSVVLALTEYMKVAGIARPEVERGLERGLHSAWPTGETVSADD